MGGQGGRPPLQKIFLKKSYRKFKSSLILQLKIFKNFILARLNDSRLAPVWMAPSGSRNLRAPSNNVATRTLAIGSGSFGD